MLSVGLWWRAGGLREMDDLAGVLTGLGRVTGMLGAYLALVELLLLARIPALDRLVGSRRLTWLHRVNGVGCLVLLVAHTVLITAGYAVQDATPLGREVGALLGDYSGVLIATIGLALLAAVVVTSAGAARRRLPRRAWRAIHLTAYAGVALGFSHQLATGHEFAHQPVARAAWTGVYVLALLMLASGRVLAPLALALRHRLRVERVVPEAPGVVSLEIGGRELQRLRVHAGQFFHWRFLSRRHWRETHPFSLSAAPDGRRLRVTVKRAGAFTEGLGDVRPGTRVLAVGPFGDLTPASVRRPRVALIAGGVGIAPLRALLETVPGGPGDIALVYRASREEDVLFAEELRELARRRGAELHLVLGGREATGALGPDQLAALVPDIAERDVFVCGPPAMTALARASLRTAGVPRRHIISESFA